MAHRWTESDSRRFFTSRRTFFVLRYPRLSQCRSDYRDMLLHRETSSTQKKEAFFQENALQRGPLSDARKVATDLEFWAVHSSWTFCKKCKMLHTKKLLPGFARRHSISPESRCQCLTGRYQTPRYSAIPLALRGLSLKETIALRPLDLHNGDYSRQQHGYRKKTSMTRVTWSSRSVEEKIANIEDVHSRKRCEAAYQFLMSSEESKYSDFVRARQEAIQLGTSINVYDHNKNQCIECALWPSLYPKSSWCETLLSGNDGRLSSKVSFMTKVLSEIRDYAMQYDLLQFHFDRWLFTTVTGAISTGASRNSSPARALETKTFSTEYWRWEHKYLVDGLHQYGFPDLFVTLSPYEWSFPFPWWLEDLRERTGKGPTELAAFETLSIVNTLEQLVRGYLCGSNEGRWKKHVFGNQTDPASANVLCYFYRFEFQDRGTVHLHLLVWLQDVSKIAVNLLHGHIPWEDAELAYLVSDLQHSNKRCLEMRESETRFVEKDAKKVLELYHPADAFALRLRAYVTSMLPALKCRMDVQTTDGRSMILRYVTSYVTKWQDAYSNDALYSMHLTSYMAAYRHLREMTPCEPEMWMHLTAKKIAWSKCTTKKFVAPRSENVTENALCPKYWARPAEQEDLTLLEWLRTMKTDVPVPVRYKNGKALVGVKYVSVYNEEYFFQYILLNVTHRNLMDLKHPRSEELPQQLKFFAAAAHLQPNLWMDCRAVKSLLDEEGHKETFVTTVVTYVQSLHDMLNLWKLGLVSSVQLGPAAVSLQQRLPLRGKQIALFEYVKLALTRRRQHYSCADAFAHQDDDNENMGDPRPPDEEPLSAANMDWTKILLVTGKPGTGKSHLVMACIQYCLEIDVSVLVACPTGFLASRYRSLFGKPIQADTIHGAFYVPVGNSLPKVNWELSQHDLIVIDELSMVPTRIVHHIMKTIRQLPVRSVLLMTGDQHQQQPIDTVNKDTVQVANVFQDRHFTSSCVTVCLTDQHRCQDSRYESMLNHIRHWPPTDELLHDLQEGRVLCPSAIPNFKRLVQCLENVPQTTILTISKNAAHAANEAIVSHYFGKAEPLTVAKMDDDHEACALYEGMRVIITQNRNKSLGIVNGQEARIHTVQGQSVLLALPDRRIVCVHPVTEKDEENQRRTVLPIIPGYALTVCKAQGQTLESVVIWFDCDTVPAGTGYVALSRVKTHANVLFFVPIKKMHLRPVLLSM